MQTHFTMVCACFRCGGFADAFRPFSGVNQGRCLKCNGGLRTLVTKPIARLAEYHPNARAESIATLAKCLELVGVPHAKDARGRRVCAWGFPSWVKGDNERMLAAALTIAPADVRARFWRAFTAKVRATMPAKGDRPLRFIARLCHQLGGVKPEDFDAWVGVTGEVSKAA